MNNKTSLKNQQERCCTVSKNGSAHEQSLRKQAEEKLLALEEQQSKIVDLESLRQIAHELRVHQIELEMQNEELLRYQEDLEISRARYIDLYDFAPVGYLTINRAGIIIEANHTAAVLLGVLPGTLVQQPFSRFVLPEDQDNYYLYNKLGFETSKPQTCKLRLLRTKCSPFWARLESTASQESEPGLNVRRLVLIDIGNGMRLAAEHTQLKNQERQLQKAESLGLMAGAIAHSFNNILTVVMGNLELVMLEEPKGLNVCENLLSAFKAAGRAADISGSMLVYLGQAPGKQEPLDLSEVCRKSLYQLLADMPNAVNLKVDFPPSGPHIQANANHIHKVIKNLMVNAWEALGDGQSTIKLTITTEKPANIQITQRFPLDWRPQDRLYACLEVTDTGCGIDEKDIDKVFDPFFTQKFIGRGLGLPLILGIMRAHHGAVTVASKVSDGTTIKVYFPVCDGKVLLQQAKA